MAIKRKDSKEDLTEKLTNLWIEVPKTLTMNKAMELIKEKLGK